MASKYWVGGTATWDATAGTKWATTSGGAGGASVPLVSDDVFFNASSGAGTVTMSSSSTWRSLNCTGFTGTLVHPVSTTISWGDGTAGASNIGIFFSTTMTYAPTAPNCQLFAERGPSTPAQTITLNGHSLGTCTFGNSSSGNWRFQDTFTSLGNITLKNGTLDTNGQTVNGNMFSSSGSNTRTLTMGASTFNLSSTTTALTFTPVSNLTVTANTATFNITGGTSPTITSVAVNFNGASVNFTGGGAMVLNNGTGQPTFANLTVTGSAVKTDSLNIGTPTATPILTGNLNLSGQSLTNRLLVFGGTLGTASSLSVAGTNTLANCDFQDVTAAGTGGTWSGTSLGNAQGNSNITFTAPVTRYAVVAGNWSNTATWSSTSGGSGGSTVPLCHDTVNLDTNSGAGTYVADMPRLGKDVSWAGFTRSQTLSSTTNTIYGNLTLGSGMTSWTGNQSMTLAGRGSQTITMNGYAAANDVFIINAPGGTYTQQDNFFIQQGKAFTFQNGTYDANGFNWSADNMTIQPTFTLLKFGSGTWNILRVSSGTTINNFGAPASAINAGTATIKYLNSVTGNQTIILGTSCTWPKIQMNTAGSTGSLIIQATTSATLPDIIFSDTSNARTITFPSGVTINFTATHPFASMFGLSGKVITANSSTSGTPATLNFVNGYAGGSDWMSVKDITATTNTWYAGVNSTNVSGNTNVTFTAPPAASANGNFFQFF